MGSNLNDRHETLERASNMIRLLIGEVCRVSSVYQSDPWGFDTEHKFLNQALHVETQLSPEELMKTILGIEDAMGRTRNGSGSYESRIIDIDILFYNDAVIRMDNLEIPHPRLHERKFALVPMMELNELLVHPGLNRTLGDLARECTDTGSVEKYIMN